MKLDPRFLVLGSLEELGTIEIERRATGQLKEHCVVQIFVGVAENAELLGSLDRQDIVRKGIDLERFCGRCRVTQLTETLLCEPDSLRGPPENGD